PFVLEFGDAQQPGAFGLYGGTNLGVGLGEDVRGDFHNLTYGAMSLRLPVLATRLGGGPSFATRAGFGGAPRGGRLATLAEGIDGLVLAADWFSGDGGYVTPGLIYSRGPWTLYLGYGFANTGRQDDLITMEVGLTVR